MNRINPGQTWVWLLIIFCTIGTGVWAQSADELALFRKKLGVANFVIDRQAKPFTKAENPNGYTRQNDTKTGYFLAANDGNGVQVILDSQSGGVDYVEWFEKAPLQDGIRHLLLSEKKYVADGSDKTCRFFTNGAVGLSFCIYKNGLQVHAYLAAPSSLRGEFTWDEPLENNAPATSPDAPAKIPTSTYDLNNLQSDLQRTEELATRLRVREQSDSALKIILKNYCDTSKAFKGAPLQVEHYERYLDQLDTRELTRRYWLLTYYFNSQLYQGLPKLPGHFPGNYAHIPAVPEVLEIRVDTETGKATLEKMKR